MKKLMFAVAAVAAGVAMADVTSANVVGYQTQDVKVFWMMTPTFSNIDGTDYNIHKFTVAGSDDGATAMQILNDEGGVTKTLYWYNEDPSDPETYPAGWWTEGGQELDSHNLKPGEGVIINNSSETGIKIQSAGQVPGAIEHDIVTFTIIGNGTPVPLLNHKMTISDSDDGATAMQILNDEGGVSKTLYWYNEDPGDPETYPAGWWSEGGQELVDHILQPGDSVILNNSSETGVKVHIPAAL